MKKYIVPALIILALLLTLSFTMSDVQMDEEASIVAGIDMKNTSLFFAAFFIGLLDGFNPCAMWVLVYLITMASQMQDKKKMWMIVGIFLLASGVLYYALLAGWVNLFILTKVRWVMIVVGIFAIGMGAHQLFGYWKTGGEVVCDIGNAKTRKKTMSRIEKIMLAPITIPSIIATIGLAFAINAVEFLCSAGLPAIFAQLLIASDVSTAAIYGYNLIYVLAFMLDDLVIFGIALFAMQQVDLNKYSGYSKLIGGLIMVLIGIVLVFFPGYLR